VDCCICIDIKDLLTLPRERRRNSHYYKPTPKIRHRLQKLKITLGRKHTTRILRIPKVHYRVDKISPVVSTLNYINLVHILAHISPQLYFILISQLHQGLANGVFSLGCPSKMLYIYIYIYLSCTSYVSPNTPSSDYPNNYWRTVKIMKLPIMQSASL
jgi:hypothetical protein